MKKILSILLSFVVLNVGAQTIPTQIISGSTKSNRLRVLNILKVDSVLKLPGLVYSIAKLDSGDVAYNRSDSSLYTWTGSQWLKQGGSGGGSLSGSGTTGKIPKFTGSTAIGNSLLSDNGTKVNSGGIIEYNGDYTGSFTDNTLVTNAYLTAQIAGISSGSGTDFINISIAALQLLTTGTGLNTTKTYYLTDAGKEGPVRYTGTVAADRSSDNGATVFVTADFHVMNRIYPRVVDAGWFGVSSSSTAAANVTALRKARDWAYSKNQPLVYDGDFSLNDSIQFASWVSTRKSDVHFSGVTSFTSLKDGFILTGTNPQSFVHTGTIDGANSGATDSTGFAAYVGRGVYMKNLWNSVVEVNEIKDFKMGLEQAGDQNGGNGTGSQYDVVRYNYLHHNYANVHITTYGTATGGNFVNESFWYGSQLGQGVPNVTYGGRGTFGLLIDKDPSSNAPRNGINGHVFYNFDVEAGQIALKATMSQSITFVAPQFEPLGTVYQVVLDTTAATGADNFTFIGFPGGINENLTSQAYNGTNTKFLGGRISSLKPDGTACCVPAGTDMVRLNSTKKMMILNYGPTGFSDEQVNTLNDRWFYTSDNIGTEMGKQRFNGLWRYGQYKGQLLNIPNGNTGSTTDDTLLAPPNLGLVKVLTNEAKVVKIRRTDLNTRFYETFYVWYATATGLSFIDDSLGVSLISSGTFTTTGWYKCNYVLGSYTVYRDDGAGAGSSQWVNVTNGINYPADATHKVGIGQATPTAFLHLRAGIGGATANSAPLKIPEGTLLNVPEAGALEFFGGSPYYTPSTLVRDKLLTENNVAVIRNKIISSLLYSQTLTVNVTNATNTKQTILSGGLQNLNTTMAIGDQLILRGTGTIALPTYPTAPTSKVTLEFYVSGSTITYGTTQAGNTNYVPLVVGEPSRNYEYEMIIKPQGVGTSVSAIIEFKLYVNKEGSAETGGYVWRYTDFITGFNTTSITYNVSATWNNSGSGHTWNSIDNTAEIKRK